MSAATELAPATQVVEISIDQIDESPTNPRKTFDQPDLEGLAKDIAKRGILQPVLVRTKGKRFELIVGARRYRASKIAKRETLTAIVVEMDDLEVLEAQIVENAKRSDIHPLEEANAYQALIRTHGLSADEVAAKVARSRSAVYGRLKLCELCPAGQKALLKGDLLASVAELIARIPDPKLQKEATSRLSASEWSTATSFRQASEIIQDDFMLRLKDATWDVADVDLVPAAGSCATCPKRTGNQRELFGDVKSVDVCTDPKCFAGKRKAAGEVRLLEAKKSGAPVLSPAESKKILDGRGRLDHRAKGYIDPKDYCNHDPQFRSWKKALGKHAPTPVLATAKNGEVVELYKASEAKAALKIAQPKQAASIARGSSSSSREKRRDAERKVRRVVAERAMTQVVQAVESRPNLLEDRAVLALIARGIAREVWHETLSGIVKRRGIEPAKRKSSMRTHRALDVDLASWTETATVEQLDGLIVELVITRDSSDDFSGKYGEGLLEIGKLVDVDVGGIDKEVKAGLRKLAWKKAAKKKGKAKPKKAAKKRAVKRKATR